MRMTGREMSRLFWLNDDQWATIEPFTPKKQPGARRVDDRRVISGIIHVLKTGCRWIDCPQEYGPPPVVQGAKAQGIGPSRGGQTSKIHVLTDVIGRPFAPRLTPGNVSDVRAAELLASEMRSARHLIADKGYDANAFRNALRASGTKPVIPGRSNHKRMIAYDKARYRHRHLVENAFCRLKDFRRIATRYDKLAWNFLSAVAIGAIIGFWV